jgi:hypothetical protein
MRQSNAAKVAIHPVHRAIGIREKRRGVLASCLASTPSAPAGPGSNGALAAENSQAVAKLTVERERRSADRRAMNRLLHTCSAV